MAFLNALNGTTTRGNLFEADGAGATALPMQSVVFLLTFSFCAGHSLHTNKDLTLLTRDARLQNSRSAIIVEVERDNSRPKGNYKHCLYVILPGGQTKRLGRQVFAESGELKGDGGARLLTKTEEELKRRTFTFRNKVVVLWRVARSIFCAGAIKSKHARQDAGA